MMGEGDEEEAMKRVDKGKTVGQPKVVTGSDARWQATLQASDALELRRITSPVQEGGGDGGGKGGSQ